MQNSSKLARCLRATGGALVFLVAVGWTGTDNANFRPLTSQALAADATLTSDQISAIQSAVQTAITNVNPSLTGAAKQQAIQQAIAQATTSAIATYGAAAISTVASAAITAGVPAAQVVAAVVPAAVGVSGVPASVTVESVVLGTVSAGASPTIVAEAVIATGAQVDLGQAAVGNGLGAAAAQLSKTNADAGTQVAQVVSNEGTTTMGQSFSTSVTANGGSQQLAQAGTQNPNATGATNGGTNNGNNGTNNGNNNQQQGSGGSTLPPCSNPSCT
ncbi:MAG: hypothetical protein KGJ79_04530 [Alphaproteobacteria bacterium]|nr:hypothetical protein [Alphaproteobacteria bacterium]MDE2495276.1 hypothetical protein [Alphaproteobacteria bacterium]